MQSREKETSADLSLLVCRCSLYGSVCRRRRGAVGEQKSEREPRMLYNSSLGHMIAVMYTEATRVPVCVSLFPGQRNDLVTVVCWEGVRGGRAYGVLRGGEAGSTGN